MKMIHRCLTLLLISAVAVTPVAASKSIDELRQSSEWVTLQDGIEFQSADSSIADDPRRNAATEQAKARMLNAGDTQEGYQTLFDADGLNTKYDILSTAWRYLGFYIDCSVTGNGNNKQRDLGGGNNNNNKNSGCMRYLMWAVYVDLEYEGAGIGEYQYYNRFTGEYDDASCAYPSNGNNNNNNNNNNKNNQNQNNDAQTTSRCAKMDCHEEDTHFSLLGFFKSGSSNQHEWFGQLFKHEGVCLWNDYDEYSFMQKTRDNWPVQCKGSGIYDEDGTLLYYHLKPSANGDFDIGLYTDEMCAKDYKGELDMEEIIYGLGWSQETIAQWNNNFDVYKICQPCVAYSLAYMNGGTDNMANYAYNGRRDMEMEKHDSDRNLKENGKSNQIFNCYDQAGYTNCNQCMKFATKTTMLTASLDDVMLATQQGSITYVPTLAYNISAPKVWAQQMKVPFNEKVQGSPKFFGFSLVVFIVGLALFYVTFNNGASKSSFKEPLVRNTNMVQV